MHIILEYLHPAARHGRNLLALVLVSQVNILLRDTITRLFADRILVSQP
jgi:hypothetical protein